MQKIVPPQLEPGDEIRVVAPSTGIKIIGADSRDTARKRFEEMGLKVTFGQNTVDENFDLMGTSSIEKRAADIIEAFADPQVKAVFTIIGGFNSNQLLPFLDYETIRDNPKILCGFSDITALVNGIYAQTGLVTFLGPHYSSFGMAQGFDYTWEFMRKMLLEGGSSQVRPSAEWSDDLWFIDQQKRQFISNEGWWVLQEGEAEGTLVGGNIGTMVLLNGSPYRPAFEKAKQNLTNYGFEPVSPLDNVKSGDPEKKYLDYMVDALHLLDSCDAICMIGDWPESYGALMEYLFAARENKQRVYLEDGTMETFKLR